MYRSICVFGLSFYNYVKIEKYENIIEYTSSIEKIEDDIINTNKLCNYIGGILYINLDKRIDRRKTIEAELDTLKCPYQRLSATYVPKNGAKGCAKSHIDAITIAKKNKWKNVVIIEDDFVFKHNINYKGILYRILQKLNNNFDVLMLSGHLHSYYKTNIDESLFKVNKCVKLRFSKSLYSFHDCCHDIIRYVRLFGLHCIWASHQKYCPVKFPN